ncbi:GNAT family N-acetyltransferase [Kineococcus sp. R8]|nr:GNAT family N-acetyltransferase [Kineococcus siccus]
MVLTTARLQLRPWRVEEAGVIRQLWRERDTRVPPHRRLDAHGRPTLGELEQWVRAQRPSTLGFLAVQRAVEGDVIGNCGLLVGEQVPAGEPEIAVELLRDAWHQGFATEAVSAVLDWAGASGHRRVWATVREWNSASRRVLAKVGFEETGRREADGVHGDTVFLRCTL